MRFYLTLCSALFLVNCSSKTDHIEMVYGQTGTSLFQLNNKQLAYTVKKEGQMVLDTSLLGVKINGKNLGSNSKISFLSQDQVALKYALNGIKQMADYKGDIHSYEVTEADGFKWKLEFQLSNEGVAYRYIVPGEGSQAVMGEATTFKLPEETKVWYFERDSDWKLKSHAGEWLSADISRMPTVSKMGPVQGLTLTCELPQGGYALLAEAALYNYSGLRLEAIGNNTFKANFTEGDQGFVVDGTALVFP